MEIPGTVQLFPARQTGFRNPGTPCRFEGNKDPARTIPDDRIPTAGLRLAGTRPQKSAADSELSEIMKQYQMNGGAGVCRTNAPKVLIHRPLPKSFEKCPLTRPLTWRK